MPKVTPNKPELIVAGPGAGKTWDMVQRIREALAELSASRYLAAITYTNAAADSITRGLGADAACCKNLFIGTTHAFVNRFILLPFATLFEKLPPERIFGAVDIRSHPAVKSSKSAQASNGAAKWIGESWLRKGVVPYDLMLTLARELIKHPSCRSLVSQRLQFLFIDEFQDADSRQLDIFDEIRKAGATKIFGIGDPEQYITSFSYALRGVAPPEFSKIPFFRFRAQSNCSSLTMNHRSNANIVTFLNGFRTDLVQTAEKPQRQAHRILYSKATSLSELCKSFRQSSDNVEFQGPRLTRLYLGYENNLYRDVADELGITPISAEHSKRQGALNQAVELISWASGLTERKLREHSGTSRIELRKIGMAVLSLARTDPNNSDGFWEYLNEELKVKKSTTRLDSVEASFRALGEQASKSAVDGAESYATIHKAKGLEADAVLVVAKTNTELQKWLTSDIQQRNADKQDTCRLGYVAFSRPREYLAIGCLQELSPENEAVLTKLGAALLR